MLPAAAKEEEKAVVDGASEGKEMTKEEKEAMIAASISPRTSTGILDSHPRSRDLQVKQHLRNG